MSNEQIVEHLRNHEGNRQELLLNLYEQNSGIIFQTVKPYINTGLEQEDAMQEGFFGMCRAVDEYDPARGTFASCLRLWVRQVVGRWHKNTINTKRLPVHMIERIRKYNIFCQEYERETGRNPPDITIRAALRITQEQLEDLRKALRERELLSLGEIIPGSENITIGDSIPDPAVDVEGDAIETVDTELDARRIWAAVDSLPENRAKVIRLRYEDQKTMSATGEALGISRERVRQQEYKALRTLKRNKEIKQIGRERGYGSTPYHGSISRFRNSGYSIEEDIIIRKMCRIDSYEETENNLFTVKE